MTSNRRAKRAARELAASQNIRYTAARRAINDDASSVIHPDSLKQTLQLLGIENLSALTNRWTLMADGDPDRLRAAIGTDPDGRPVMLDLKDTAAGGHGPHGEFLGLTGAGKSELLRTLLLGLCVQNSPQQLQMVLVNSKWSMAFQRFESLPHVKSVLVADDAFDDPHVLADRFCQVITDEIEQRTELLSAHGFSNVADYERARERGRITAPVIPTLLVVIDEYHTLLDEQRFIDMLIRIGRTGRSLRVHMVVSSQLRDRRMRDVEPFISYRIAMKVGARGESRAFIGEPDAADLPYQPGGGILQTGNDLTKTLQRFQALYVSTDGLIEGVTSRLMSSPEDEPG